jgi:uncharacterized protein involved in response to NO
MTRFIPFAGGFRPFFLFAGVDAPFNMALWLLAYFAPAWWPADAIPAMYWHAHEMIFGFVAAAIGGFLLTAVPGWTGRSSYAGAPLAALAAIWLAGRIAMLPWLGIPPVIAAVVDLAFFPALVITLTPPLVRARKLRNMPFAVLLTILFLANLAFHLGLMGRFGGGVTMGLGIAIDVVAILIVVIGGRIVPAFTRSGLARRGIAVEIAPHPWLEYTAIAAVVAALAADLISPNSTDNGIVALIAGAAQAVRLAQWQGQRTLGDPLIWVLHLGYGWLALAFLLKGIWLIAGAEFAMKWLHALTAGAFATMILAVMTRASLGHTGRALIAPRPIALAYLSLSVAALVRVFGPAVVPGAYDATIALAGGIWIAGFLLFLAVFAPILLRARADGRPD